MANIQKRGDTYTFRVSAGYDADGKQVIKTMTWKPPAGMNKRRADKEARHEAELFEEKVRNGMVGDGRMKLADFAKKWMDDYAEAQLRPRTVARYRAMLDDRILPTLGYMYLDKIFPAHLIEFYKELAVSSKRGTKYHCEINLKSCIKKKGLTKEAFAEKAGVSITTISAVFQGKNVSKESAEKISGGLKEPLDALFTPVASEDVLSSKTVLNYHRLLSSIMRKAVRWQLIPFNPCERVDPPKVKKAQIECLDVDEAVRLVELLGNAPIYYRTAIIVLLFTGMRRGELLGLEWRDIDFSKSLISISRSQLYLPERGLFEDATKNESSERILKVSKTVLQALMELHRWQMEQSFLLADAWMGSNKVFTGAEGDDMRPDTLTNWFRDFIDATDLPPIHLHSLRHTNATLAIANGVAITTVAGQLGHADANTTTKIYAHAIQSAQAEAADRMEDILSGRRRKDADIQETMSQKAAPAKKRGRPKKAK